MHKKLLFTLILLLSITPAFAWKSNYENRAQINMTPSRTDERLIIDMSQISGWSRGDVRSDCADVVWVRNDDSTDDYFQLTNDTNYNDDITIFSSLVCAFS